ncbi:GIY-YIG catalytic domain-containing protein [Xylariaceae sp. FL0016]|nr:GIY-YIG catalytic domain-containing protein [Xylariaceae sp. FL0016]
MAALQVSKPIPPLYTVYILRSTVHHASLYIGSTPNPPRRLKQHNGDAKGGAARTSRKTLRPWEMVGLVSGFPGMVAALKFEWALTNPHVSLHIPSSSRISIATQKKRNGAPRRPRHSITSIVSNLHLLLRVPSFARWPLRLHFFAPEVYRAWRKWCGTANEPIRGSIHVCTDFKPASTGENGGDGGEGAEVSAEGEGESAAWGIHALPLDYAPMKEYVSKTQSLYAFEREGDCVVCQEQLQPGEGLYATCSNAGCEATGHISCWSRHLLADNDTEEAVMPTSGQCPRCRGEVLWGDMMKELSLRLRGPKEVEKLLKKPRRRKAKATTTSVE